MKKRTPPPTSLTYTVFQNTFKAISHIFFREVKVTGLHNVPTDGPCIFIVGPHANQFVDGVVFFGVNPRPSYAIMAAVSYHRPLIGHVGKILNAIPVVRPQDVVIRGTGHVIYDPDTAPHTIRGVGTQFTKDIHSRDFLIFGRNYKFHVHEVLSDTECTVTHAIAIPVDERQDQYSYKIAPHIDQTTVYNEVNSYLNNNECITIFPEGGSHDRTDMLPLKAGFAVMALGAMAEYPDLTIPIVPVGMNYFHPDRFRSRAVVSFGQPFTIERADVEQFQLGGQHKRDVVTRLLDKGDEAFKTVTTSAPDMETMMVIQAVRRLYMPFRHSRPTIDQVVQMNQNFGNGWQKLKDDPELHTLSRKVKMYNDMLMYFGIRDRQVGHLDMTPFRAFRILVRRLVTLGFLAGLGAPAYIMNLPITLLVRYISKKKQREALAGSMVKIKAKDVIASWKVIVASIATPALYGFYSVLYLVFLVLRRPKLSLSSKVTRVTLSWIIQPILHYILMRMGDTGFDIYKSIKPLFLALRNPEVGRLLRDMRADLSQDITTFVNAHADVLLPDTVNDAAAAATDLKHDPVSSSPAIPVSG